MSVLLARMVGIIITLCYFQLSFAQTSKGVLFLVPGTYHTPGQNAFSDTITQTLKEKGYDVYSISSVQPFKEFEPNGLRLLDEAQSWYLKKYPEKKTPIIFLAHSAGGFYALHAISQNPSLPIRKLIFLSTPLNGSELADYLEENYQSLKPLLKKLGLSGLFELTTSQFRSFLARTKISSSVEVYSVGGSQPKPETLKEYRDARYLSLICTLASDKIPRESDGMVSFESALGTQAIIPSQDGGEIYIHRITDNKADLDHFKQGMDYKKFSGVINASYIRDEQKRFYSTLLDEVDP